MARQTYRVDHYHDLAERLNGFLECAIVRVWSSRDSKGDQEVGLRIVLGSWHTVKIPLSPELIQEILNDMEKSFSEQASRLRTALLEVIKGEDIVEVRGSEVANAATDSEG